VVAGTGKSTDLSTPTKCIDVPGDGPMSFRHNNPGARYPSAEAARFGQISYGVIGYGHKIARFPSHLRRLRPAAARVSAHQQKLV